ncbi:MAG: hypothetical protein O3B72_07825 [Proteobacteria bacterium]|nr:hypothetical protein [Pseudomonadota bacterium]
MNAPPSWKPSAPLTGYFVAAYATNLCIFYGFTDLVPPTGLADSLFLAALCITYPLIYMMPAMTSRRSQQYASRISKT